MRRINGIDISHWQGDVDFNKVKASGCSFVIIKAGGSDYGFYTDKLFKTNYEKAKAAGLFVGAYYFVGKNFLGIEAGIADAKRFEEILKGLKFEYPVYVDIETTEVRFKEAATDAAISFCNYLQNKGYFVGIYASDISGFRDRLNHDRLTDYTHWCARYGSDPKECKLPDMWQYTSKGRVRGINTYVDLDFSYVDFAKLITEKGFNGYKNKKKEGKKNDK